MESLCKGYGFDFFSSNFPTNKDLTNSDNANEDYQIVKKRHGFQDMARRWRKQKLESILDSVRSNHTIRYDEYVTATAHHRDDLVESLMLKLLRGAHITNMHAVTYS